MEQNFASDPDIRHVVEAIPDRLYLIVVSKEKTYKSSAKTHFLNVDEKLIYINFNRDFGPLNLSCLYKYCCKVDNLLNSSNKKIVHITKSQYKSKANSAFLMGCFCVLYLHMRVNDVLQMYVLSGLKFKSYVDASQNGSQWTITLEDCFSAVRKAHKLNFFDFSDFSYREYDYYNQYRHGDLNWLLPRKFLAFTTPTHHKSAPYHNPEFYVSYFLKNNVKTVIQLNNACYNTEVFTGYGIQHYHMYFADGSTPPKCILTDFMTVAENSPGAIAVHCKAGLGRTGTLIAAYVVKHYNFTAREAIAWLRVCRSGSVVAHQQGWLERVQAWLWEQGESHRSHFGQARCHKYGIYSVRWSENQERLMRIYKQSIVALDSHNDNGDNSDNADCFDRDLKVSKTKYATQGDKLNSIKFAKQDMIERRKKK